MPDLNNWIGAEDISAHDDNLTVTYVRKRGEWVSRV